LSQLLQGVKMDAGGVDSWFWKVEGYQSFTVNSAYIKVRRVSDGEFSPIYCRLWRCKVLSSAVFLAWRVLENRIATRVNLVRREVVVENPVCCLCGKVEESSSHLFSVCDFSWRVWCLCFEWLGVLFIIHFDPMQNFIQFRLSQTSVSVNDVWGAIWVGIVSEIWKHRNSAVFNGGVTDVLEVFASAQVKVWSWIAAKSREVYFFLPLLGYGSFGLYTADSIKLVSAWFGWSFVRRFCVPS